MKNDDERKTRSQLELVLEGDRAGHKKDGPETSRIAATMADDSRGRRVSSSTTQAIAILSTVEALGTRPPPVHNEIDEANGWLRATTSRRLCELERAGLIVRIGRIRKELRRPTDTGRPAMPIALTALAEKLLEEHRDHHARRD